MIQKMNTIIDVCQKGGIYNGMIYQGGLHNIICLIEIKQRNIFREMGLISTLHVNVDIGVLPECTTEHQIDKRNYRISKDIGNIFKEIKIIITSHRLI